MARLRWGWAASLVLALGAPAALAGTIAGGVDHTVELKNDGTVWSWGGNSQGQLGNGTLVGSHAARAS